MRQMDGTFNRSQQVDNLRPGEAYPSSNSVLVIVLLSLHTRTRSRIENQNLNDSEFSALRRFDLGTTLRCGGKPGCIMLRLARHRG